MTGFALRYVNRIPREKRLSAVSYGGTLCSLGCPEAAHRPTDANGLGLLHHPTGMDNVNLVALCQLSLRAFSLQPDGKLYTTGWVFKVGST